MRRSEMQLERDKRPGIKPEEKLGNKPFHKLPVDSYTLKATVKLRRAEDDEQLQQAIREGNQEKFEEVMQHILDYQVNWGDHIKRYILDVTSGAEKNLTDLPFEKMVSKIYNAFASNGMADRGSIHPKTVTRLQDYLESWLNTPAAKLDRETCFLFAFGLNMDEEQTSYMLTDVLRKADFNPRSPEEAIYYYCLRKNLKYAGVLQWLQIYEDLAAGDRPREADTLIFQVNLQNIAESSKESEFVHYLRGLKYLQQSKTTKKEKKSNSRAMAYNQLLTLLYSHLSTEYRQSRMETLFRRSAIQYEVEHSTQIPKYKRDEMRRAFGKADKKLNKEEREELERILVELPKGEVPVSKAMEELLEKGILQFPVLSPSSIRKKIEDRTTEVQREDVLLAAFFLCTYDKGKYMADKNFAARKANFEYMADYWLLKCGFSEVYLLSPFELCLTSCLLQERPLEYVLAIWKKHRKVKKKEEKNETTDSGQSS